MDYNDVGGVGMALNSAIAVPTVTINKVQQRYPWNEMVDIDYTITGDETGCKIEIGGEDKESETSIFQRSFFPCFRLQQEKVLDEMLSAAREAGCRRAMIYKKLAKDAH